MRAGAISVTGGGARTAVAIEVGGGTVMYPWNPSKESFVEKSSGNVIDMAVILAGSDDTAGTRGVWGWSDAGGGAVGKDPLWA